MSSPLESFRIRSEEFSVSQEFYGPTLNDSLLIWMARFDVGLEVIPNMGIKLKSQVIF